jgi:hypothetical protein
MLDGGRCSFHFECALIQIDQQNALALEDFAVLFSVP